jgi:hypothetical protein
MVSSGSARCPDEVTPGVAPGASIGLAAFVDKRPNPVFPRWFGYLNFILGIALLPGVFVYVASDGPFAWNGLFTNIIPSIAFLIWKIAMIVVLLKAVKSEERETLGSQAFPRRPDFWGEARPRSEAEPPSHDGRLGFRNFAANPVFIQPRFNSIAPDGTPPPAVTAASRAPST